MPNSPPEVDVTIRLFEKAAPPAMLLNVYVPDPVKLRLPDDEMPVALVICPELLIWKAFAVPRESPAAISALPVGLIVKRSVPELFSIVRIFVV